VKIHNNEGGRVGPNGLLLRGQEEGDRFPSCSRRKKKKRKGPPHRKEGKKKRKVQKGSPRPVQKSASSNKARKKNQGTRFVIMKWSEEKREEEKEKGIPFGTAEKQVKEIRRLFPLFFRREEGRKRKRERCTFYKSGGIVEKKKKRRDDLYKLTNKHLQRKRKRWPAFPPGEKRKKDSRGRNKKGDPIRRCFKKKQCSCLLVRRRGRGKEGRGSLNCSTERKK